MLANDQKGGIKFCGIINYVKLLNGSYENNAFTLQILEHTCIPLSEKFD